VVSWRRLNPTCHVNLPSVGYCWRAGAVELLAAYYFMSCHCSRLRAHCICSANTNLPCRILRTGDPIGLGENPRDSTVGILPRRGPSCPASAVTAAGPRCLGARAARPSQPSSTGSVTARLVKDGSPPCALVGLASSSPREDSGLQTRSAAVAVPLPSRASLSRASRV
jgi:hypothetical protein